MIQINKLNKSFNNNLVLDSINLNIQRHKIYALLGPSGSGKSTLLRCINLLEIPDSGTMRLFDINVNFEKIYKKDIFNIRKHTGMVFQNYNLFANKTALQNITLALIFVHKYEITKANEIGRHYLNIVGLSDKENYYPNMLSGGQQQRIGIARALAFNPDIILFDEPTSALDPELVDEVLNVIKIIKDKTMILVTHELNFARKISDEIIFMSEGKIIEQSTPQDFFNNPKTPRAISFLNKFSSCIEEYII